MIIAMSTGTSGAGAGVIPRCLQLERLLARRSVFLFGPRQTGKTTYVRTQLAGCVALTFTLLDRGLLTSVLADPSRVRREVEARGLRDTVICIDEIQKCPELMDEVQLRSRRAAFGSCLPAPARGRCAAGASTCSAGAAATG